MMWLADYPLLITADSYAHITVWCIGLGGPSVKVNKLITFLNQNNNHRSSATALDFVEVLLYIYIYIYIYIHKNR